MVDIGRIAVLLGAGALGAASAEGEKVEAQRTQNRKFITSIFDSMMKSGDVGALNDPKFQSFLKANNMSEQGESIRSVLTTPAIMAERERKVKQQAFVNSTIRQAMGSLNRGTGQPFLPGGPTTTAQRLAGPSQPSTPPLVTGAPQAPITRDPVRRGEAAPAAPRTQQTAAGPPGVQQPDAIDQFVLQGVQKKHPDVSFTLNDKGGFSLTVKPGGRTKTDELNKTLKSRVLRVGSRGNLSTDQVVGLSTKYGFTFTDAELNPFIRKEFLPEYQKLRKQGVGKKDAVARASELTGGRVPKAFQRFAAPAPEKDFSVAIRSTLSNVTAQVSRQFGGTLGGLKLEALGESERQNLNNTIFTNVENSLKAQGVPDVAGKMKSIRSLDPLALFFRPPTLKKADAVIEDAQGNPVKVSDILAELDKATPASVPALKAILAAIDAALSKGTAAQKIRESKGIVGKLVESISGSGESDVLNKEDAETLKLRIQFKIQQLGG